MNKISKIKTEAGKTDWFICSNKIELLKLK